MSTRPPDVNVLERKGDAMAKVCLPRVCVYGWVCRSRCFLAGAMDQRDGTSQGGCGGGDLVEDDSQTWRGVESRVKEGGRFRARGGENACAVEIRNAVGGIH